HQRRIRPLLRRAAGGAIGGRKRLGESQLLRELPAYRRNRPPRARYAALWPDEAGGACRSAHWQASLRSGAITPGKSARRFLQSGRLPEPFEVWRAGAGLAPDPWPREREVFALWPDPPQYLRQCADVANSNAADEAPSQCSVCRT